MKKNRKVSVGDYVTYIVITELDGMIECEQVLQVVEASSRKAMTLMQIVLSKYIECLVVNPLLKGPNKKSASMNRILLAMLGEVDWNLVYQHLRYHCEQTQKENEYEQEIRSYYNGPSTK